MSRRGPHTMYARCLALLSTAYLILSSVLVGLLGIVLYHDLSLHSPVSQVKSYSVAPITPGQTVNLEIEYTKKGHSREAIVDRWIACENGTQWSVHKVAAEKREIDLRNRQKVNVTFTLPEKIEPEQTCLYGSIVRIPRIILPDITLRMPPVEVPIRVISSADYQKTDTIPPTLR